MLVTFNKRVDSSLFCLKIVASFCKFSLSYRGIVGFHIKLKLHIRFYLFVLAVNAFTHDRAEIKENSAIEVSIFCDMGTMGTLSFMHLLSIRTKT